MGKKLPIGPGTHCKAMAGLLRDNARRHRLHKVFADFCEMAAIAISNSMDRAQRDKREARYMEIVGQYEREEVERFAQLLGVLVEWLECGFADCLGELFMTLELSDHWKGQYFTPYELAGLMARMTLTDARETIERQGFITINEPACGAGAMVIACADALQEEKINYQRCIHVTAQDIDATAVHMTYLQLSLLHIPAIVIHGNSIAMTEWAHWVTPAHVLGFWDGKLLRRETNARIDQAHELPTIPEAPIEPLPFIEVNDAPAPLAAVRSAIVSQRAQQLGLF
jgi:hypothetical protein